MKYVVDNGILNIEHIQKQLEYMKQQKLLDNHPYKIWQGKDGKWYTYLPDKEKGRILKKRNTEKEINNIVIQYQKTLLENPTLKEVFDEWNERRLRLNKISQSSYDRYRQTFERHYCEMGKRRIKDITPDEIEDFLEEEIARCDLTAKGFSGLKLITKGFLKRASKRKLIDLNITDLFNELDVSDTDFRKTIKEDYEEVFDEYETPIVEEYIMKNLDLTNIGILLMFVTGIRVGELSSLKYSDFHGNTFNIRRTETRYRTDDKNKNGNYIWFYGVKEYPKTEAGVRTVVIPNDYKWILKSLKQYNPNDGYIFERNGKRMNTNIFRRRLERICKKTNVYLKSPHKIRKTYVTILLDNKVDKNLITQQVGHSNILVSEQSYHRNRKNAERKTQILSSIPDFQMKQVN